VPFHDGKCNGGGHQITRKWTVGEAPFWGFEAAAIYGLWGEINHLLTMGLVHNINDLFT
jgi:hypothetical protein